MIKPFGWCIIVMELQQVWRIVVNTMLQPGVPFLTEIEWSLEPG